MSPRFLEQRLRKEYPNNPSAVYGTLNAIGAMAGNKETSKGRAMQAQHNRDVKAGTAKMAQGGKVQAPRKVHPNSLKNLTAPKFTKKK
jgi:hypothetical protein